jgi:hypothetical protein
MRKELAYRNKASPPESDNDTFQLTPEMVADMDGITLDEAKRRLQC